MWFLNHKLRILVVFLFVLFLQTGICFAVDVSDDFNRTEDPMDVSGNWRKGTDSSELKLDGSKAIPKTNWTTCFYYWNADAFSDNQYSEATEGVGGGVIVRSSKVANTYYSWHYHSGYDYKLDKVVAGVATNLATVTTRSGYTTVRLEARGNLIVGYVGGTVWAAVIDGDISSGSPGIYADYSGGVSGWSGGDLATTCTTADCYDVVSCVGEETVCRQPKDLSVDKIQTTINVSSSGDGVYLISGSATWTSQVTAHVPLVIKGAGKESTLITLATGGYCDNTNVANSTCVLVNSNDVEVSDIGFRIGHSGPQSLYVKGTRSGVKIHDNDFRRTVNRPSGNTHHVQLNGLIEGVIYKNTFYGGGVGYDGPNDITNWYSATGLGGTTGWIFVEGNIFSNANSFGLAAGGTRVSYGNLGAKIVFRYNSILNEDDSTLLGDIDAHSFCSGARAHRAYLIHHNYIDKNSGDSVGRKIYLRGGTGLVYRNKINGIIELNEYRIETGQGNYGEDICPCVATEDCNTPKTSSACFSTYYGVRTDFTPLSADYYKTLTNDTGTSAYISFVSSTGYQFSAYTGAGFVSGDSLYVDGVLKGTASQNMETFHGEGHPCYDQIGRGNTQASEPYYFWNNVTMAGMTITPTVPVQYIAYIVEGVDYCNHDVSTICNVSGGGIDLRSFSDYSCPHTDTNLVGFCDTGNYGVSAYDRNGYVAFY